MTSPTTIDSQNQSKMVAHSGDRGSPLPSDLGTVRHPCACQMLNASHTHPAVTSSPSDLQAVTLFVWTALMFIGDASGPTDGGVKLTVGVVAAALVSTLRGDEET